VHPSDSHGFDIIADVHGHADALYDLLASLGYAPVAGVWCHPNHRAIFVGDFIDGGSDPGAVLRTVSAMISAGRAFGVMGNHELNVLRHYRTTECGSPLQRFSERQAAVHETTVRALVSPFPAEWRYWLAWMERLPLWCDFVRFRVVHACWDRASIEILQIPRLPVTLLSSLPDAAQLRAVDRLLNGPRIPTPCDGSGGETNRARPIRLKWWLPHESIQTLGRASVDPLPEALLEHRTPMETLPPEYSIHEPPVIVGHYSRTGSCSLQLAANVVCVDAGVNKGGPLKSWFVQSVAPREWGRLDPTAS
jgi:hypothetical protein